MANSRNGRRREEKFRRIMAERGIPLVRPEKLFRFTRTTYRPDWYAPSSDTYFEVLGSRQRKWAIVAVLDLMEWVYPEVRLLAVTPDGESVTWAPEARTRTFVTKFALGSEITAVIKRLGWTYSRFAAEAGIHGPSLSQWNRGRARPCFQSEMKIKAALARLSEPQAS